MQKYSVNQYLIGNILNWIKSGEIAIPEIQRPFVWSSKKVRDLLDSLYKGYPIGYIITWKNPNIRLKDGSISSGKKIIIDGQQRIVALQAAILGEKVIDKDYRKIRIKIAFHPVKEQLETLTPAIEKDKAWIKDISDFLKTEGGPFELVRKYQENNKGVDINKVEKSIDKLFRIRDKQIGFIDLDEKLDIETVTEIFIRINREGVTLSQADFSMSKIASYGDFGEDLRKAIDYFCHTIRDTEFISKIGEIDASFAKTAYLSQISWIKDETDDLYQPDYSDVLRVSFTQQFSRGRLKDLVSLLSGRNFETREYEERIVTESFDKLKSGVLEFVNETNYKRFLMIIKSAGFISKRLVRAQNPINFAYIIYLKLKKLGYPPSQIEKYVKKWFMLSVLTSAYSGSAETQFDVDIRQIDKLGIEDYLKSIEQSELSSNFWEVTLPDALDRSLTTTPALNVFWAAQVNCNDHGFLSSEITVRD